MTHLKQSTLVEVVRNEQHLTTNSIPEREEVTSNPKKNPSEMAVEI
jgi:hypothetical protein